MRQRASPHVQNDHSGVWLLSHDRQIMSPDSQLRYNTGTYYWSLYWADRNGRWHRYVALDPGPVGEASTRLKPTSLASSGVSERTVQIGDSFSDLGFT